MSRLFIDIGSSSLFKSGQKIGGDVFLLSRNPDKSQIVCTLSDGLGSGVKANVLASLTARMAHKLSFSPMHLVNSATIIMNTLPVCKERKISYSTFTIADIRLQEEQGVVLNLVEYDNPRALVFVQGQSKQWEPQTKNLHRQGAFKEEVILHSTLTMEQGDRLILFSDGVSQAGLGTQKNLGWRRAGVESFVQQKIRRNPDIGSKALAEAITAKALELDIYTAKDDITTAVVFVRSPRRTLIVTGPPFSPSDDEQLVQKVVAFEGKKIISGGTTAHIVSRLTNKPLKMDMKSWSKDIPPCSKMEGVDLVTEGMLTLCKVAKALENKQSADQFPDDAVRRFLHILEISDHVHFIVGTKINEAHQDPKIPVEIGIRRTLISRICRALEELYLKETTIEYI